MIKPISKNVKLHLQLCSVQEETRANERRFNLSIHSCTWARDGMISVMLPSMWNPLAWSETGTPWWMQTNGLGATLLHWTSSGFDPPTPITGSKPGWTSGKRGDWCCDPGPTTPSPHILISWYFLLDRLGMPPFCLSWSLWNAKLHNKRGKYWIAPSPRVFVCLHL